MTRDGLLLFDAAQGGSGDLRVVCGQGSLAMSPIEFVAKTRLHHAAELLRSTDVSIKVIAASNGFTSRGHFSRAFRSAYGTDPRNFRRTLTTPELDAPRALRGSRGDFGLAEEPVGDENA